MALELLQFEVKLRKIPVLSLKEEVAIFQRLEREPDNQKIIEEIITANLRLVAYWANKIKASHPSNGLEFYDLFQEGYFGLVEAVKRFDWKQGHKFSTYATWWIRQTIQRAIGNSGRTIRLPIHVSEAMTNFFKTESLLAMELGRNPTPEEIAVKMGIPVAKIQGIHNAITLGNLLSLEWTYDEDGEHSLGDLVPAANNTEEIAQNDLLKEAARQAIEFLNNDREERVIELRYGLEDGRGRTLEEVGREFGLTRERIRQIEQKAIWKLRANQKVRQLLKDFH